MAKKKQQKNRIVDYDSIKEIAGSIILDDIQTANFTAETIRPLTPYIAKFLNQKIKVRGKMTQKVGKLGVVFVEFEHSISEKEERLASISGSIVALYETKLESLWDEIDDGLLQQFAEVNGIYNTWSYIRELVASSFTRLGLSGVLLPIWRPPHSLPPEGEFSVFIYEPDAEQK